MADKVLIYRPLGEHPPGTKMGDLLLGAVHEVTPEQADIYAKKSFVRMPADARTAKADALESAYVRATKVAVTLPRAVSADPSANTGGQE